MNVINNCYESKIIISMYNNRYILVICLQSVISRTLDLSKESKFKSHVPQFEQSEVEPADTSAYVSFQTLNWYNHDINYELYISELNIDNYLNDGFLFTYPPPLRAELFSYLSQTESLWKEWKIITTNKRIYQLKSLTSGSFYRIKYTMKSKYSSSKSSRVKYIPLKRKNTSVSLFVRGTGRNNHNNAQILLNNDIIFNNGKYQGLALIVLSRYNLQVKTINYFDTYTEKKETQKNDVFYEKYFYDETNNIISETVVITMTKEYKTKQAELLLKSIKQLKKSDLFVLVSCYGWEKYFTIEVAEFLTQHGGLKIKELNYAFYHDNHENVLNYDSLLEKNYYHHPYALVGIPYIGSGNGYEIIQTNKGHYLSTDNLPNAEVLVHLTFDEHLRVFLFKTAHKEHYNFINHIYLHKAMDFSLKNMFPLLVNSNVTTFINSHFNIFEQNTNIDHLIPGYVGCYQTELDRVVLGNNQCSTRSYFNGGIYQNGLKIEEEWYYNFYLFNGLHNIECFPPYEINGNQCLDTVRALTSSSQIVKCRIGISPQLCNDNQSYEKLFYGFD